MASFNGAGKLRTKLYIVQRGLCPYCGRVMPKREGTWKRFTNLDHVYPRARQRWRGNIGNLMLAHSQTCNLKKGDRMPYACEVLYLEAVNLSLGVKLRKKPSDPCRGPTPKRDRWAGLTQAQINIRSAQSKRDKAAAQSVRPIT